MEVERVLVPIERTQSIYRCMDEQYQIVKETYRGQQYSQIYFIRLHAMRCILSSLVPNWKPHLSVCNILGLEKAKECVIVGTLYKNMKLKPSVLDEYSKERSATPLVNPHNFVHQDDILFLEDESGRVKLCGEVISPSLYVTGVVVALHGKTTDCGDFLVDDVLEAGLPPQIDTSLASRTIISEDKYVAFISGLGVGSTSHNPLQFQLFVDHITGHLGDENEQRIAAQIVHVIVAGNSVEISQELLSGKSLNASDQSRLAEPIKELDLLLTQIAAGVPLDIMPGPDDPANFYLPQQPLHMCLFPGSSAYNTFRSCPNPHSFELDDVRFIGTSGQNVDDFRKYSELNGSLDIMERTLRWRHVAPTTPNTLGCYPFTDKDPFVIEECPQVYFVGNQNSYETRLLKGAEGQSVRIICIPKFHEKAVAVILNLRNLECHALTFSTHLS